MIETLLLKLRNNYRKVAVKVINKINNIQNRLPKNVKYPDGSLYDAIYESAVKYPYNTALEYGNIQITYRSLMKRIDKCARALKALGIKKGDKVTICMPNTPEEVSMFYAINEIGAIANMVHPLSSERDMEYYLNKSESRVVLCIDVAYSKIKSIIDNTKVEKVIVASATKSMEKLTAFIYWLFKGRKYNIKEDEKVILWNHFINLSSSYEKDPYEQVDGKDAAVILYSGGTTGKSKGVVISNFSFNAQALQSRYVSDVLTPENAFLTFLPNFHAFGLGICTHTPLYHGMRVVLIPQFNGKKIRSYIRKYKINILCGVPTFYDAMTKMKFKNGELKCLKLVVCGGDALSLTLKQKVNKFLKEKGSDADIRVGYGLTESSGVIALSPEGITNQSDVIGLPFPDCEFKILDINTNKECGINEPGEIVVGGPNLMMEYLGDLEETNNAIYVEKGKRYLHTGDIGFMDGKGLVHYKSRLKRMIITSGYNVYPAHVEEVIMEVDGIKSCAVIGVPSESKGEIVKAFVTLKDNVDVSKVKSNLVKHLKEELARYEQPREIRYIDDLPTTLVGKIAYKELENMK